MVNKSNIQSKTLSRVTHTCETGARSGIGLESALDHYAAMLRKIERIIKHLVAAIGGLEPVIHDNQAKMGTEIKTNQEEMKEELKDRVGSLASQMDTNLKEMTAEMRACQKETTACQETTEACVESKEPTPVEIGSVAVQEEVPMEEATVKTVRGLKKQYGDRHLAVGHC
jgi:gas vesicle protein